MANSYELFDLRIFRGQNGIYPVEVLRSPAGEADGEFRIPFQLNEIAALLEQLESGEADRKRLQEIGQQLYQALFTPGIERRYNESLALLKENVGLRVRLRIDAPELTVLPWEFLCGPQSGDYLSLSPRAPLVRYVTGGEAETLETQAPVRLLLVVSSPADAPPLETAREIDLIQQALAEQIEKGFYVVDVLEHPTFTRLADKLREGYHILHYLGHAYLDPESGRGYLVLENDEGNSQPVDAETLDCFFKDTPLRLLVLNACESGRSGGRDAQLGLAPSLVSRGVPAVIAMQFPIPDQTAILLSHEFYSALADNAPVDAAMSEARKLIRAQVGSDSFDWGIPVLFMRSPDGMLLHVTPPPKPKAETLFSAKGWAAIIAGVIVLLGLIGSIAFGVLRQAGVIPTPEPTLVGLPAGEDEFLVLVADFYPKEGAQKYEIINRLAPEIISALQINQLTFARVLTVPDQPRDREEVLRLAKRYNASVVVWGWYDPLGFEASVEIIESPILIAMRNSGLVSVQTSKSLGEVDSAPETLRAYLRSGLSSRVNYLVLYTVGRAQYAAGYSAQMLDKFDQAAKDYLLALNLFSSALEQIKDLPEGDRARLASEVFYSSIGSCYYSLYYIKSPAGDLHLAEENLKKAIEINPSFAEPLYRLGSVYLRQKKYDEAKEYYTRAVAADNSNEHLFATKANNNLGYLAYIAGNKEDAEMYWRKAYTLNPNDAEVLQNLGFIEYTLGKYLEAITITEAGLATNPDERLSWEVPMTCNLGLFYVANEDSREKVNETYDRAITLAANMRPADAYAKLSVCKVDLEKMIKEKGKQVELAQALIVKLESAAAPFAPTPTP